MGAVGALMCEGEYESLKALHEVAPRFVPKPVSWGRMVGQGEDVYFILEEFRNMGDEVGASSYFIMVANGLVNLV